MGNKYSRLQISIHWLVFLLVIVAYCAMEFRGFFPRSDRPLINMIHVSCGISILVLMVVRLLLRLKYPTPPIIPKPKPMMTGLAHLGHLVIYLLFIALPVIGLVMMYNRGNQASARQLLQFIQCLRERRLTQIKGFSRAPQSSLLCDSYECMKVAQTDALTKQTIFFHKRC